MWRAYKNNKGIVGLAKNLITTLIYILVFAAGFVTASYVTHDYFKQKHMEGNIEHQSHKH